MTIKRILFCFTLIFTIVAASAQPGQPPGKNLAAPPGNGTSPGENRVTISVEGEFRLIKANGLPDHLPGQFPNRGNPNSIEPQSYTFRVPAKPKEADKFTPLVRHPFGVAVNGVVFDPGAAEWWNDDPSSGWTADPISGPLKLGLDQNNAHVQPSGAYHYHGLPTGLIAKLTGGKERMILVGWAADGFPIYGPWAYGDAKSTNSPLKKMKSSWQLKKGTRPNGPGGKYDGNFVEDFEFVKGSGDLDEANGRFGLTPEFPQGSYHYFVTEGFPFIPREYKGTPDQSFMRRGPPGGPRGPRRGGPGGPFGPPSDGKRPPPPGAEPK